MTTESERLAHDKWFRYAAQTGQPISTLYAWLACAADKDRQIAALTRFIVDGHQKPSGTDIDDINRPINVPTK